MLEECTLPTAARPLRQAEFEALFATAVREVWRVGPTHLRLSLAGETGLVETVRDLTRREVECCSFFDFAVTPLAAVAGEAATLDIRVPARQVEVLDALSASATARLDG